MGSLVLKITQFLLASLASKRNNRKITITLTSLIKGHAYLFF